MNNVEFLLKELKMGQKRKTRQKALSLPCGMLGVPNREEGTSLGKWDRVGTEGVVEGLQAGPF